MKKRSYQIITSISRRIAHTEKSVASINKADFNEKVNARAAHFRTIATHTSAADLLPSPGEKERE
jgi:hypothetical protein